MTLIQFKSKRIGQGTKAVHMKSAPNNVASVNDTKIYNICQKVEKYKEKMDTNTRSAAAAARDTWRERESERRGQIVMKEIVMEVERKVRVKRK